ncbi:Piwi-domain-containing protein [Linnemannia elongata AG-77]|uniref:Piwi-domain-containing protein n=1 Tax=Linnemannia elongata AG-77 TaxID=1314771 RepID=A0A197JI12_9FUNG|nr:Piwi-domain-containing protein [Linnemannia elongata AG-77]
MSGLSLTEFVERPDPGGSAGRAIKVNANFFEITQLPNINVHHYDVTITPDVSPAVNRRIFEHMLVVYGSSELDDSRPVFDGRKNIFSPRVFPFDSKTFDITLPGDEVPQAVVPRRPPRAFKVKIKKASEINLEELHRFLNAESALSPNCLTAIMALDILIHHKPAMLYSSVGRSFFSPNGARPLSGGVEVWNGFYQSARPTLGRMLINLDVAATVYFQPGSLLELAVKILNYRHIGDLRRGLSDYDRGKLEKSLRGLLIKVTHRGDVRRSFKISKLTLTPASSTFFMKENTRTTVAAYFLQAYGRRLQYPFMPCVVTGKDVFLPMEICSVIEGQRHVKKLNETQTAEMIKFTCQPPQVRANKIKDGLQILNYHENEFLNDFGMRVANEMVQVDARVLPAPTISYHPSSRPATFVPRDGSWDLRGKRVTAGATLSSWGVVVFGTEQILSRASVGAFIRELIVTCVETGMKIPNKDPQVQYANPHGVIEDSLQNACTRARNAVGSQPQSQSQSQLLVCILPNKGVPLYAEIKRVGDTVIGIPTQCIQMAHTRDPKKNYCVNVCLKINVKLGGINAVLSPHQIPFLAEQPTILFGADVSHPSPGDTTRPSIASLVGSMDAKAAHYVATVRLQTARTEIIADLQGMVVELLRAFYETTRRRPQRILFYRDGVSEGQFVEVLHSEVASIRAACTSLWSNYEPTITFVVVQKRHHARFFPSRRDEGDAKGNCKAGTVVDTGIVHPFEFDFYLQSHASLQGTARPTHYHVLYDQNGFTSDGLQQFTYKLCHLYARCTRTVSLVPPAYYAHLVAARARFHFKGERWLDTESSQSNASESTYLAVKPELRRVMYFM